MKRLIGIVLPVAAIAGVGVVGRPMWRDWLGRGTAQPRTEEIARGTLEVWHAYEGIIESGRVQLVRSRLSGSATLTSLVPDGSLVEAGDVLARFDSAEWEREMRRLERDATVAREDLRSLEHAKLPLEIAAIESRIAEGERALARETRALEDTQALVAEDLVSELELRGQRERAEQAATALHRMQRELELTRTYLHPALVARARAQRDAAQQELDSARAPVSHCTVRASSAGRVVHVALPIGADHRTARVGDTLYRNQPFIQIPDTENLVFRCAVPEADLLKARVGAPAVVVPLAYPDLRLEGIVEAIGAVGDTLATRNARGRALGVTVAISSAPDSVRAGMSARVRVRAYAADDALKIPRRAVAWDGSAPHCTVWRNGASERKTIRLGQADMSHFEVLEGLRAGDRVVVE